MTTSSQRPYSGLPIPPGEILEEELEARGMTPSELAARIGRPAQVIEEIIRAEKSITPEIAIGLSDALDIESQFWINLELDYRATLERSSEYARSVGNLTPASVR